VSSAGSPVTTSIVTITDQNGQLLTNRSFSCVSVIILTPGSFHVVLTTVQKSVTYIGNGQWRVFYPLTAGAGNYQECWVFDDGVGPQTTYIVNNPAT
jgi:hypothetical protein